MTRKEYPKKLIVPAGKPQERRPLRRTVRKGWILFLISSAVFLPILTVSCGSLPAKETASLQREKPPAADTAKEAAVSGIISRAPDLSFYGGSPNPNLPGFPDTAVILEGFRPRLAEYPWSDGCAALQMVLQYLKVSGPDGEEGFSQERLARSLWAQTDRDSPGALPGSADNYYEFGTGLPEIVNFIDTVPGCRVSAASFRSDYSGADLIPPGTPWFAESDGGNLYPGFREYAEGKTKNGRSPAPAEASEPLPPFRDWLLNNLHRGLPVIVKWADGDGQWAVIIGYDDRGSADPDDDMLIFADPADQYDGIRDGYSAFPLPRWFALWHDRHGTPRPWQLQPYVVAAPPD